MAFVIGMTVSSCTKEDPTTTPDVTDTTNTGGDGDNPADTTSGGGTPSNENLLATTFPEKHIKSIGTTFFLNGMVIDW